MRFMLNIILSLSLIAIVGCQSFNSVPGALISRDNSTSDQAITTSIKSALFDSGAYTDASIQVITESQVVTLSGFVKTIRQYDSAVQLASEMSGVKGVRNHLVIRK